MPRENVESALRENDGSAALGPEATAGVLRYVEDGPRREPEEREKVAEIRCSRRSQRLPLGQDGGGGAGSAAARSELGAPVVLPARRLLERDLEHVAHAG